LRRAQLEKEEERAKSLMLDEQVRWDEMVDDEMVDDGR